MVIVNQAYKGQQCVFSACNHAQATHTAFHEFANHPAKPLCSDHADKLDKYLNRRKPRVRRK